MMNLRQLKRAIRLSETILDKKLFTKEVSYKFLKEKKDSTIKMKKKLVPINDTENPAGNVVMTEDGN